jgi:hypothetical protein
MFKPTKGRTLDLGKKYLHQASTAMLIQNNTFGAFSKDTTSFIDEYIKKQTELRNRQKAALSIDEKRGAIDATTTTHIQLMTSSLIELSNVAIQCVRVNTDLYKSLDQLKVGYGKQKAIQEFRSENVRHLTGPLAGLPMLQAPKIDIRRQSELSPHERLFSADSEYRAVVKEHNEKMGEYNNAVKEGETAAKAMADIKYIKDLAKDKPSKLEDMTKLADKISKTGDLASATTLMELEKQTGLGQQTVDNLSTVIGLLGSGGGTSAGAEILGKAAGSKGINREILLRSARTTISSEIGLLAQSRDFSKIPEYIKGLQTSGVMEGRAGEADYGKIFSASAFAELTSSFPAVMKDALIGSGAVDERGYKVAAEQGALGQVFNIPGVVDKVASYLAKQQKQTVVGEEKSVKASIDDVYAMKEPAEKVEKEVVDDIIEKLKELKGKIGEKEEALSPSTKYLEEKRKAERNLEKASGQLAKTVGNLTDAFRDLERQSIVNQKLIETRAEYLSTRGGPMRQTAPSVSIDTATTAQYSPHELLYNKSKQYKDTITGYLKTSESLKAARSKVEEITKIEGKAEFMETQGYSKEKMEGIINKALLTGSMDSALMITEQEKTNALLGSIDGKTVDITKKTKGGELADGAKAGDVPGREKSVYKLLDQQKAKEKKAAKYAEQENIVQAEYIRAKQIETKTALDIAAGRGRTQDQVNREESEWLTSIGYVPTEIKDRNKKLVQVHKEEKSAREKWELKKQEDLKPLQKSAGGMRSLIDSIQTGVSGIRGARNIRPLDIEFTKWSEKTGDKELVADRSMQFDLAKSLYSQNLNLRAGGADTGVAPKKLYDIMQKASRGEDVTKDLEQIQGKLKEKEEKRKEQVRKMQAEEYARALKEVMTPSDTKLGAISDNTGKLITTMGDVGHNIADAINNMSKTQPATVSTNAAALSPEQKQKEMVKSASSGGFTMTFPEEGESVQDFADRTGGQKQEEMVKSAARGGLTMTFPEEGESVQDFADRTGKEKEGRTVKNLIDAGLTVAQPGAGESIKDEEKVTTMAAEVNKQALVTKDSVLTKPKDISEDKQKKFDDSDLKQKTKEDKKVGAEQKKETKNLNDEVSNLKDEIVTLKTTVSDVNKAIGTFSKGLDTISDLGKTSKDSATLIETLGRSASDTSYSLDTLSNKVAAVKSTETETAPTMKSEEGYKYIPEDSDIIKDLVEQTNDLRTGVNSIEQELLEVAKGLVTEDSFNDFKKEISDSKVSDADMESIEIIKNEVANYFDTVSELKGLIVTLEESTGFNTDLSEKLSVSMDNIVKRLMEHDDEFVDIQKTVTDIDTSFSFIIDELREEVSEAIDLSRSAYNLVNM